MEVLEREIWRIAVENLDYPEQHAWAALAGARVNTQGWRRARAMLQNDQTKELRRRFLLTCVQRNRNAQLRLKALGEIADLGDADAFDDAIDIVGTWSREDKRAGTKTLLQALIDKRIGRRDQAQAWVWRLAEYTRELHEEYAVQRWPETKRLLGLLVNSSGPRPRAQRAPTGPRGAQTGPPPGGGAARRGGLAHAGGRGGPARGADADGPETVGGRPRAAAQLPQRRQAPAQAQTRWRRGRGRAGRTGRARTSSSRTATVDLGATAEIETERRRRGKGARGDAVTEAGPASNGGAPEESANADPRPRPAAVGDGEDAKPAKAKAKRKAAKPKAAKAKEANASETGDGRSQSRRRETGQSGESQSEKPAKAKADKAENDQTESRQSRLESESRRPPQSEGESVENGGSADSEAGQMDIAGTEGDAVAVGESDE